MNQQYNKQDSEIKNKFQELLYSIFRVTDSQLNFGIYRIFNLKRNEIRTLIEKELPLYSEKAIEKYFLDNTMDPNSTASTNLKRVALEQAYEHLFDFFSRYYDEGDFVSQRKYAKDPKYVVPYNGEEVLFYWANNDQYFVKSCDLLREYSFIIEDIEFNFNFLEEEVQLEQTNNNAITNKYIIFENKAEHKENKINIYFSHRSLTDSELKNLQENVGKIINQTNINQWNLQKMKNNLLLQKIQALWKNHPTETIQTPQENDKTKLNSEIEWHLERFTTKNTFDFFIHKNLKSFFAKEKEMFIKSAILNSDSIFSIHQLQIQQLTVLIFNEISNKLISFLHQFEEFQRKLWEKPKFVISTDYLITLDLIPLEFVPIIMANQNQIEFWKANGFISPNTHTGKLDAFLNQNNQNKNWEEFFTHNPTLMIDTKFFSEAFKWELLSRFENLDESTTGILINSDNYHALRLISNKYKHKIKVIYIDPPYNTGGSEFIYKNKFQHSSWLSMMDNRLDFVEDLLNEDGVLIIAIDDFEINHLGELLKRKFGEDAILGLLAIEIKPSGRTNDRFFSTSHEYAYFVATHPEEVSINFFELSEEQKQKYKYSDGTIKYTWRDFLRTGGYSTPEERPNSYYPIYFNELMNEISIEPKDGWIEIFPLDSKRNKRVWRKTKPSLMEHIKKGEIRVVKNSNGEYKVQIKDIEKEGIRPKSFWYGSRYDASSHGTKLLRDILPDCPFSFPKSIHTVKDCIKTSDNSDCIILDFFAGSGTMGHAVLQLNSEDGGNRKFILVEMGEYFESTLKNRVQRVIYSENWKDGKPIDNNGHPKQLIKYLTLEQYEDSLENIRFDTKTHFEKIKSEYLIEHLADIETKESPNLLSVESIENPFDYKLKIMENKSITEKSADLIETFNFIRGIHVQKVARYTNQGIIYVSIIGTRQNKSTLVIWRNLSMKKDDGTIEKNLFDPQQDKQFIENNIIKRNHFDEIYVNGNSLIEDAISIEPLLKKNLLSQ